MRARDAIGGVEGVRVDRVDRALLVGVVAAHAWLASRFQFVCDDAWISFRYARHLAEGRGLVFNVGESPPVEGFSNLAWVLLAAVGEAAGVGSVPVAVAGGAASAVVVLALVAAIAAELGLSRAARTAALVTAALSPGLVVWTSSGLETMLACALLVALAAAWVVFDAPLWGGVVGVMLVATRTEGVGWVLVVAALAAWARGPRALRGLPLALGGVVAVALWRYSTYGTFVSNTAVAKVSADPERLVRGASYVAAYALSVAALPVQAAATLPALGGGRRWAALALLAWGPVAFAVLVGGDFMVMGRLLVASAPFVALCVGYVADRARGGAVGAVALALVGSLVLADVQLVPESVVRPLDVRTNTRRYRSEVEQWRFMKGNAARWSRLGRALAAVERPGESIVLGAVGAVGYHSELFIYDRFGLVTPEVARRAGSSDGHSPGHDKEVPVTFFLDQEPTFLDAALVPGHRGARALSGVGAAWPTGRAVTSRWGPEITRLTLDGAPVTLVTLRRMNDPSPAWAAWRGGVPEEEPVEPAPEVGEGSEQSAPSPSLRRRRR